MTLVELILSVTLLAAIAAVCYTSLWSATRSWRVGTETANAFDHADFIMDQITTGLRSAYYPDSSQPSGAYGLVLSDDGDEDAAKDALSWVKIGTSLVGSDSPVANAPHRVYLYLLEPGESPEPDLAPGGLAIKAWRITAQPDDFDPYEEDAVRPVLLAPRVVAADFNVLDPEDNLEKGKSPVAKTEEGIGDEGKLEWTNEWTDDYTNRLPYAVDVTLYFAPAKEGTDPVKVKRIVTLPCAPLSWQDHGAAGGGKKTNRDANEKHSKKKGLRSNEGHASKRQEGTKRPSERQNGKNRSHERQNGNNRPPAK